MPWLPEAEGVGEGVFVELVRVGADGFDQRAVDVERDERLGQGSRLMMGWVGCVVSKKRISSKGLRVPTTRARDGSHHRVGCRSDRAAASGTRVVCTMREVEGAVEGADTAVHASLASE